jgi:hypothetical protein
MPAYQSAPEIDLSERYRLKAVGCEQQADHATDQTAGQEWRQLAAQWYSMADQAATRSPDETSPADLFR